MVTLEVMYVLNEVWNKTKFCVIVAPCHDYIHALICGVILAGCCRLALYDEDFSPLGRLLVTRDRNTVNTNILLMLFSSYSCVPLALFPGQ